MPRPVPFPPPGFDDLSNDEKIDYLELLWDRIATRSQAVAVPEWHRKVIAERTLAVIRRAQRRAMQLHCPDLDCCQVSPGICVL